MKIPLLIEKSLPNLPKKINSFAVVSDFFTNFGCCKKITAFAYEPNLFAADAGVCRSCRPCSASFSVW
ncbi:MAG: hypothetical protein L6U16_09445 [Porphyromonadaceae bacterium]|nr:MAG: hypothetical protein L6U16_09445 [Porphyromonadaceae bacterium]